MAVYHHLSHALRIMREQPNYRLWGPMIDVLPIEAQDEVRQWLRQQVELRRMRDRINSTSPVSPRTSSGARPR